MNIAKVNGIKPKQEIMCVHLRISNFKLLFIVFPLVNKLLILTTQADREYSVMDKGRECLWVWCRKVHESAQQGEEGGAGGVAGGQLQLGVLRKKLL